MTKTKAEKKIEVAVATLCRDRPYIIKGVLSLRFYKDETGLVKTMATDKYWRTYYNEDFVRRHSINTLAEVIYHELLHLLFEHFKRLNNYDKNIANLGGDCEINDNIKNDKWTQNKDGKLSEEFRNLAIFPSTFNLKEGMGAEYYCRELEKNKKGKNKGHSCGSCAHGKSEKWEDKDPNEGGVDGISEVEAEIIKDQVAKDIAQGLGRGDISASLIRWAEERIKSKKIPWTKILKRKLGGRIVQGMYDYNYSNRERKLPSDYYFPGPISYNMKVGAAVDTSGSMSYEDLGLALDVIKKLSRQLNFDVTFYAGDVGIQTKEKNLKRFKDKMRGGGGTSMANLIKEIDKDDQYDVIICITDGGTDYPEKRTKADLIVAIIDNGSESYGGSVPKWATRIEVQVDGTKENT